MLLALTVAASGCSMLETKPVDKANLKNAQGHVIGYTERLSAEDEELARVVLFTPRLGEYGSIVAYEERVKGGAVLRDLSGKRIGNRYVDLRSRGSNAHNAGLTIVFRPRDSEHLAQLHIASVTIEDIKQHLGITN